MAVTAFYTLDKSDLHGPEGEEPFQHHAHFGGAQTCALAHGRRFESDLGLPPNAFRAMAYALIFPS